MAIGFFKKLFGREEPPHGVSMADALARDAARFASWGSAKLGETVDVSLNGLALAERALELAGISANENLVSDAAAFMGEVARREWGGEWTEDELLGVVVKGMGGISHARMVPLAIVEKKVALGARLSVAKFYESVPDRLKGAARVPTELVGGESLVAIAAELSGSRDSAMAHQRSEAFRAWWKARHGQSIPTSLLGVREADRFLRSEYFLVTMSDERLVSMGFFLGEVARGLYRGEWSFAEAGSGGPSRAALKWTELDYYPVGKVLKLITERPDGEQLDEYIRLIPSARSELRKQAAAEK